ncbi:ADP-ribosylation factor-related protein 1 isoform X1 [Eublepharis macularius]|uniref:ADP-ribosylation factor-related protein 1 n=1 Tax=Eublepharis macularius TaxID=481883 RepID=A0AA97JFE7_EUBMA|nr:ADP-ribosylation factor-related protein 1 isoform X1 [Eublepharis macularius]XP_054836729.1 ADP-ribosylation factor-related protein 1 isoform X1 [Eublepharis macularius]XP_054836730.1 ADP-ribosylation factor-related protein 1 isoform X1 [Eublepharis macularius]
MYTLLSGLYKYMFRRDEYCILILGLDNAGKTTFLEQTKTRFSKNYKGMSLSKITTTVGLNIGTIDVGKARLMFWDLGGQEELQSLWDKYYAESHGVIYVIDSTDEERLSESKRAFEKMITSEVLEGVPLLVLANKQDVEGLTYLSNAKCRRALLKVYIPLEKNQGAGNDQTPYVSGWITMGRKSHEQFPPAKEKTIVLPGRQTGAAESKGKAKFTEVKVMGCWNVYVVSGARTKARQDKNSPLVL